MNKQIHISQKKIYILLALIIIAGITRYSYAFFVEKQGTHSDEEWSFGLANSYYEPYIYSTDDSTIAQKNTNEWISGDVLKEYLTVQEGERFSFDSVYYNMSCDTHPPLYFYILHFLSSFFVDQYIPTFSLIINIISYIFVAIFLYKLILLITKSSFAGLVGVMFSTFTTGFLSIFIYMRNYAMLAMFALIFAYLNAKLYYNKKCKKNWSIYIELTIITLLGALTHHYFLPYAFFVTAIMCLYWLIKKEWFVLFKYAGFIILGVGLSIAVFPATLDHLFGIKTFDYLDTSLNTTETTVAISNNAYDLFDTFHYKFVFFKYNLATVCIYLFTDTIGFSPVSQFERGYMTYVPIILLILLILIFATSFLFRKDNWFIKVKNKTILRLKAMPHNLIEHMKRFNWFIFSLLTSIMSILIITSLHVNIQLMGYANRYIFIVYPVFCAIFVTFIHFILKKIIKNHKKIINLLLFIILISDSVFTNSKYESSYLFKQYSSSLNLYELTSGADVIIISEDNNRHWRLTIYAPVLYDANQIFYTTQIEFEDNIELIKDNSNDNDMYLILPVSEYESTEESTTESEYSGDNNFINIIRDDEESDILSNDEILEIIDSFEYTSEITYVGTTTNFDVKCDVYKIR